MFRPKTLALIALTRAMFFLGVALYLIRSMDSLLSLKM